MSRVAKAALLLEVVLCFGPASLLLLLGLVLLPGQIYFLATGEAEAFSGALQVMLLVLAGICGLVALCRTLSWLLFESRSSLRPQMTLVLMCIGIAPVLLYVFTGGGIFWWAGGALPLVGAVHVAYLARKYLFGFLLTAASEPD
jgi:hypothetical protein